MRNIILNQKILEPGVISDINKEHNLKISLNVWVSAFLQN